ncbi:alcohol dehydrogenase catalytic domain-containing protein [bacterium]|nr:alcohol dehydrogenase catalytic domain-containing protein [bacterium]
MRAVRLTDHRLVVSEEPLPIPLPGEVLVRVLVVGICETDLQLIQGYMGFRGILGHEFVGVACSGRWSGQRVVGEINCSCHACETCRSGLPNHCPHRTVLGILNHDGAFAEYIAVPERNLHPVPEDVSNSQAVFTEPLAAALQIPAQLPALRGQRVIVLGDGRLGQLCARVLQAEETNLKVIGRHPHKLDLLRPLGIETALESDATPDHSADVVVDCTGTSSGWNAAMEWLRPRGTLVLKTTVAGTQTLNWAPIVINELQVIGSRCGPFVPALKALQQKRVDVEPLISARYPLEAATEAFELVQQRRVLKVLLDVAAE